MKKSKPKSSRTIKEFRTKYGAGGGLKYDLIVPVGSRVSNKTAIGYDDNYRFLVGFVTKELVGYDAPMLAHDLTYYGLNVPAEFCEPYQKD